jgi:hypothetical protein
MENTGALFTQGAFFVLTETNTVCKPDITPFPNTINFHPKP